MESSPTTKKIILDTAEQMFASRGYHGVSIGQIAAAVGIAKSSFFHHFASKEALYGALMDQVFDKLWEKSGMGDTFEDLLNGFFTWVQERPNDIRLLVRAQLDNPERARRIARKYWNPLIQEFTRRASSDCGNETKDILMLPIALANAFASFSISVSFHRHLMDPGGKGTNRELLSNFAVYLTSIAQRILNSSSGSAGG